MFLYHTHLSSHLYLDDVFPGTGRCVCIIWKKKTYTKVALHLSLKEFPEINSKAIVALPLFMPNLMQMRCFLEVKALEETMVSAIRSQLCH